MPAVPACDMGTTKAVLNYGSNHWSAQPGGSWILGIPALTEDCENQKTQEEIFIGLKRLEKLRQSCTCVSVNVVNAFSCTYTSVKAQMDDG